MTIRIHGKEIKEFFQCNECEIQCTGSRLAAGAQGENIAKDLKMSSEIECTIIESKHGSNGILNIGVNKTIFHG